MAIAYACAAASMVGLAFLLGSTTAASIALIASTGFFLFGAQAVMNNYQAMSYQTELRGTGVGAAQGLNRVGGILGPVVIGFVASIDPNPTYTFGLFAAALVLASIVVSGGGVEIAARSGNRRTPEPSASSAAAPMHVT